MANEADEAAVQHNFRRIRDERHATLKAVGEAAGRSESWAHNVESGKIADPGFVAMVKASRFLGVTPEELAGITVALDGPPGDGDRRRPHFAALRGIFIDLSSRGTLMRELDAVREERKTDYPQFAVDLANALEANIVLALNILRLGAPKSSPPRGKGRARKR